MQKQSFPSRHYCEQNTCHDDDENVQQIKKQKTSEQKNQTDTTHEIISSDY